MATTSIYASSEVEAIPVIDFSDILSGSKDLGNCPQVKELHSALSTVGFVFLTNHGIDKKMVDKVFKMSETFFTQDISAKKPFIRREHIGNDGYVCMEQESVNPTQPGDLKECYNICKTAIPCPDLLEDCIKDLFFESNKTLALKILEVMGYAFELKDPQFFVKRHQKIGQGSSESYTTLRLLYYPPLPPSLNLKPGQLRCGEHVDYGSITLLFQDPNGGLQVKKKGGGYIDVPYIDGAVLVNLGALMQQWTGDKYPATPHRVLVPDDETVKERVRQSIAFFVHPDNEVLVETIDGSNKYPPITALEDTFRRLKQSYFPVD
ncbi:uncharacterized protein LOC135351611 [Halichondria panicea]|uniref:uncharacterized protein LOC135351611 n=1 Tax=Halichondria panicea TaxID=6063 RepID=UPI00312BB779